MQFQLYTDMNMTDCAQNYFLDISLAEECSGELEMSNGFIVGRLADTWPEFRENAENLRIQSIGTENISVDPDRHNVIRLIVTFSDGSTQSAVLKLLANILGIKKYLPKDFAKYLPKDFTDENWEDRFLNSFKEAHNNEVEFYRLFGSPNGSKIEGFPMAKIYYSNKSSATVEESNGIPPMLIMEDLKDMAFSNCGAKFNEEQARSIVTQLAMFHKHFLCLDNDEWKNGFEKQHWFEPKKQWQALENQKLGSLQALFEEVTSALLKEDYFGKAKQFLSGPALPELLVLYDLNPGNVLFSKAEPTQVYAFIDFQTALLGNIANGVHQLHFWAATQNDALLEDYYNTLNDAMMGTTPGADGQPRAIGFGFEPLKEAFNICKVMAIIPLLYQCAVFTDLDPMVMQQLKGAYANEEEFERGKKMAMDKAENALKEVMEILTNEKKYQ